MNPERYFIRLFKAGSLVGLGLFFLMTLVYVLPLNPLKAAMSIPLQVFSRFFAQNWNLFAPNPVSDNEAILVRCLDPAEAAAVKGGLPSDNWQDITTPVIRRYQQRRLAAYERLHRPVSNAARQAMSLPMGLKPWADACNKGDKKACEEMKKLGEPARDAASKLLAKIGSSFCTSYGPDHQQVAIRVRRTHGIPWSERHKNVKPRSEDFDLGVFPVDRAIAQFGLYNGGNGS